MRHADYLLAYLFCGIDYILSTAIDLGVRCAGFRFPPTGSIPDEYRENHHPTRTPTGSTDCGSNPSHKIGLKRTPHDS